MIAIQSILSLTLAAILTAVMVMSAEDATLNIIPPLDSLPLHILELIPLDAKSAQVTAQVSSRFREVFKMTETMMKLFHESFPDTDLPDLIDRLSDDLRQSPQLQLYMTLQMKVCLFDRLLLSPDLEWDQKISALRVLIDNIDEQLFLRLALPHTYFIQDDFIQKRFLEQDQSDQVPDHVIRAIPRKHFASIDGSISSKPIIEWYKAFFAQLRQLCLDSSYDEINVYIEGEGLDTTKVYFKNNGTMLGDRHLIEFFTRCGIRLWPFDWVKSAHMYSSDLVPYLAPLFHSMSPSGLIDLMVDYAGVNASKHAIAMLQIDRVPQILRSDPGSLIKAIATYYCNDHIENLRQFFTKSSLMETAIKRLGDDGIGALKYLVQLSISRFTRSYRPMFKLVLDLMQPHVPDLYAQLRRLLAQYDRVDPNPNSLFGYLTEIVEEWEQEEQADTDSDISMMSAESDTEAAASVSDS